MKSILSLLFAGAVFYTACTPSPDNRVDGEAVREELKQREVKRVSEGEILAAAQKKGSQVATAAQAALISELQRVISGEGVEEAIRYCNLKALPIVDSLGGIYDAKIRRTSFKIRNPSNAPTALETQALEAYAYSYELDSTVSENVQMEDDEILFTKPIVIQSPLCLNCHGKPREDIAPAVHETLQQLYPKDEATGYQVGDFRGIWSITLSKKAIVLDL